MRGNENILKEGNAGTDWEMHVKGSIRRKGSKKIIFIKARVPQSCFCWTLVSNLFQVQTMGHNCISIFSTHLFFHLLRQ